MAAMIYFYKGERNGQPIPLKDDPTAITFLQDLWTNCDGSPTAFADLATKVLQWEKTWGQDLSLINGFTEALTRHLIQIQEVGMEKAIVEL